MKKAMNENKIVKQVYLECESCGASLIGKHRQKDSYWTCSDGRVVCSDCLFHPLDVLAKAFYSKSFKDAKKVIREFDEECDDSFLKIKYI